MNTKNESTTEPLSKKEILYKNNSDFWDSDLKVIDHVVVVVPLRLLLVCNQIASRVDDDEFSIVTDIKNKTLDRIELSEEYYIPKQYVTPGSIEYLPDEYHQRVVIHRHPDELNDFSSTDQKYINQNFDLSLLFTQKDEFVNGLYNLKIEDAIVQIPVEVIVDNGIEEIDISNIERKSMFPEKINSKTIPKDSYPKHIDAEEIMHEMLELNQKVDMMEAYFYR